MTIAIVDYGSGNLRSAAKAFEQVANERTNTPQVCVTAEPDIVAAADHIVLPGVGSFADCRAGINAIPGMLTALNESACVRGRPFLGICVGMQLMATTSLENGQHRGFGWITGVVRQLAPKPLEDDHLDGLACRLPHMGWNQLLLDQPKQPILHGLSDGDHVYFVHSYGFQCDNSEDVLAHSDYGGTVVAAIGRDNLVGTQFHPEKSQETGLRLISNFLRWRP
tara:strand:+ start:90 stop:758 length:669 start_codon:yes stop_codon:yes gene_type:complete